MPVHLHRDLDVFHIQLDRSLSVQRQPHEQQRSWDNKHHHQTLFALRGQVEPVRGDNDARHSSGRYGIRQPLDRRHVLVLNLESTRQRKWR